MTLEEAIRYTEDVAEEARALHSSNAEVYEQIAYFLKELQSRENADKLHWSELIAAIAVMMLDPSTKQ